MTLSVIIPNYNNEQFLEKCLDSVLTQSVLPSEIIVVDDCSTDNSRQIIENYEKQFPSVRGIYLTENGGVSHARNTGILAAKGEYVTTLDADDFYYNPQKLENEMRILREHGGNALAYSKIVLCDESGNFIPTKNHPDDDYLQGEIFSDLMLEKKSQTLMRDCCYPKQAFLDCGMYDETMSLFEDYDLLLRLAKLLQFYCTFSDGTAYRKKNFGLSYRSSKELNEAKEFVFKKNIQGLQTKKRIAFLCYRKSKKALYAIYKAIRGK